MARKAAAAEAPETQDNATNALAILETIKTDNYPATFGVAGLKRFVDAARAAVIDEVPDLTTDKGRKRIASLAATVAKSKTAVDGHGRAYLRQLKEMPKVIEAELREFESDMNALRDEVRKPLNDYEAAIAEAKAKVDAAMNDILALGTVTEEATASEILETLTKAGKIKPAAKVFGDRLEEAKAKLQHVINTLTEIHAKRKAIEDQAAENQRLRDELAERTRLDDIRKASEKAVQDERDRVAKEAQDKKDADAKRLLDAEEEARNATARAEEAECQQAETKRLADEQAVNAKAREDKAAQDAIDKKNSDDAEAAAEEQRQKEAREANEKHRGQINKKALEALVSIKVEGVTPITEAQAKQIVIAIVKNMIPSVSIAY